MHKDILSGEVMEYHTTTILSLQFLANDAKAQGKKLCYERLIKTINDIAEIEKVPRTSDLLHINYSDMFPAFKLFVKYMLLPDDGSRQALIKAVEAIDEELLMVYVH